MKPILCVLCLIFLAAGCKPSAQSTPAGHWEGNISVPGIQLAIRVDLENKGDEEWLGTIDIPAQGVRNLKLSGTRVQGDAVSFGMAGIPGDPKFAGKLDAKGQSIQGNFMQGGQTLPFSIERKPKPVASAVPETPTNGIPGNGLAGFWQGSLKPMAGVELRLVLEITNGPGNSLQGFLVSVDQGNARIPMAPITEEKGVVHFETQSIGGTFDGDLSPDGADIEGDWNQLGKRTPLKFLRLNRAP